MNKIRLNREQAKQLANFFTGMAIAWFSAGFISQTSSLLAVVFVFCGILALVTSLRLLKEIKDE